ncbi:MAG: RNA-binding protein [Patescibacteria group bacterium]
MSKKVYVGNLSYDADDAALKDHFAQAGTVVSATVIRFRDSGRSKGFGFVEFDTEDSARKAIEMFHGQDHMGRKLVVSEARPPRENTNGVPVTAAPEEKPAE